MLNVVNELQIKQKDGTIGIYKIGTVNGYYNSADGKFYKEPTHITEIEGSPHLVYADIAGNALYIYKTATSSFVKVSGESGGGGLIYGYYNETDGKFYEDEEYTTEISGDNEKLFITLDTNYIYRYDSTKTEFIQIGGGNGDFLEEKLALPPASADYVGKYYLLTDEQTGFKKGYIYTCQEIVGSDPAEYEWIQTIETSGSGGLTYVTVLPVAPNIQNIIYGYDSTVEDKVVVAEGFLDEVEGFIKDNDTYFPKAGYTITASSDGLVFKILTSLALVTGGYEATYEDTTTETFNDGVDFYYTARSISFYAGDQTNQVLYLLSGAGEGSGGSATGGVINGYLNSEDGKFYADASYTTEIPGKIGLLYLDVSTNRLYRYNDFNAKFILVGDIEYKAGTAIDITNSVISGDYKAGFGIEINDDTIKTTDFVGTQADWNSLTPAQQAEYDFVHITDDSNAVVYKPGHSISDGTTEKTQRDGLVFDGFEVTDDSVNEVTKITEIPYTAGDGIEITNKEVSIGDEISRTWTGTKAEWDAISDKSIYDGWIINITDDVAIGSGPVVDVVEDGNLNAVTSNAVYNAVHGGGGATTLDDLTDVDLTTPQSSDMLMFDGEKWKNMVIDGIEPIKEYILVLPTVHEHKIIRINSNTMIDSNYYNVAEVTVSEGEVYTIVATTNATAAQCIIVDANNNILYSYPSAYKTNLSLVLTEGIEVTIPEGGVKMYSCMSTNATYIHSIHKVVNSNRNTIINKYDVLYDKKWYALGDSFTWGYFNDYTDPEGHTGQFSDAFDNILGCFKTYPWCIHKRCGIKANVTLSMGGIDFTNVTGANQPFSSETAPRNYTMIPNDCDYITLAFGLNEWELTEEQIGTNADTTNETLWGAYNVVLTSILTNNPKVKIGIIVSDAWMSKTYHDALIEISKYWGIPYLDLKDGEQIPMMLGGEFREHSTVAQQLRDNVFQITSNNHPTLEGHKYRSTVIENFLRSL